MNHVMELGKRIKNIRKSLGLNQAEFANKINATVPAVSNWENGRNMPNDARLKSIADICGLSILDLLQGKTSTIRNHVDAVDGKELRNKIIKLRDILKATEFGIMDENEAITALEKEVTNLIGVYNSMFHNETIQ